MTNESENIINPGEKKKTDPRLAIIKDAKRRLDSAEPDKIIPLGKSPKEIVREAYKKEAPYYYKKPDQDEQQPDTSQQAKETENVIKVIEFTPEFTAELKKIRPKDVALLKKAIENYKNSSHSPESEREYWQDRWRAYGLEIDVPPCDITQEQLKELEGKERKLIYIPEIFNKLTTPEGLTLLGKMHPKMAFLPYKSADIVNESEVSGWVEVEDSPIVPKRDTTNVQLQEQFKEEGRLGMNLQAYIIASQEHKDRTGKYFDEGYFSRLSATKNNYPISARIDINNILYIDLPHPDMKNELLGGRSMYKKPPK